MITEAPNFDLELLSRHFTTCGDYTREVILAELEYFKENTDFIIIISIDDHVLNGFLIGHRNRNSLWIDQAWRESGGAWSISTEVLKRAKCWAREMGMTSLSGETDRKQMRALERYGFKEESVNLKAVL